jgi:hypothetical protein
LADPAEIEYRNPDALDTLRDGEEIEVFGGASLRVVLKAPAR